MGDLTPAHPVVTESHQGPETGNFEVAFADAEGEFAHLELKPPLSLTFLWHGMHVTVRVEQLDQCFHLTSRLTSPLRPPRPRADPRGTTPGTSILHGEDEDLSREDQVRVADLV